MIPWFYSMEEFTQFKNYKPKHRQKIIDDLKQKVHGQKQILDETCKAVRKHALGASRRIKRGDKHRATEEMMTVAFDLKTPVRYLKQCQVSITACTHSRLKMNSVPFSSKQPTHLQSLELNSTNNSQFDMRR